MFKSSQLVAQHLRGLCLILISKGLIFALFVATQCATPSIASDDFNARTFAKASLDRTPARFPLKPTGYSAIRIGTKPGDVRGYTFTNEYGKNDECYVTGVKEVPDLSLLITGGIIRRITVGERTSSRIKTDRGIGIGSPRAAVLKAYLSASVQPHKYEASSSYLTWQPGSGMPGVRFETGANRRVKVIHVGMMPELEYVEQCG